MQSHSAWHPAMIDHASKRVHGPSLSEPSQVIDWGRGLRFSFLISCEMEGSIFLLLNQRPIDSSIPKQQWEEARKISTSIGLWLRGGELIKQVAGFTSLFMNVQNLRKSAQKCQFLAPK
jgi:hypothetical protein